MKGQWTVGMTGIFVCFYFVFVLLLLLITALPILALINLFIIAVGILLEILCLTDKLVFRIISDVCIILGVISFVLIVCNIFI